MQTYRFNHSYKSNVGTWGKGETAELPDALAAHLLTDSPGCISPVKPKPEPESEPDDDTRAADAPPHDRQVKAAPKKRSA